MMTPQEQEMERICVLADSIANPQDMLACILLRLDSRYIYRDAYDRKTTEELLTLDLKLKAQQLHRIVGVSDLHDALKQRICGSVEFYLCRIGVDADEMDEFKSSCQFNPAAFDLFAGLGPDGE
jgi:hypothetical protein